MKSGTHPRRRSYRPWHVSRHRSRLSLAESIRREYLDALADDPTGLDLLFMLPAESRRVIRDDGRGA